MSMILSPQRVLAMSRLLRRRVWRRWDEFLFLIDLWSERQAPRSLPAHEFSTLSLNTLASDAELPVLERVDRREVLRRLRRGDHCFLARVDSQIAAYAWTGRGTWKLDDIAIEIPLEQDAAFLYDLYAGTRYRGRGLYYPFMYYVWEQSLARGTRTMFTRVRRRNIAALAGARYFRPTERLELVSMRVLSLFRVYRATVPPGTGRVLQKLIQARTQLGAGVLIWSAGGRRGVRVSLSPRFNVQARPRHTALE